jgi:uncharacterized protein
MVLRTSICVILLPSASLEKLMLMWANIARLMIRFRVVILIFIGVVTVVMAFQAGGVKLSYGLPRMLPDDDQTLIEYDEFSDRFKEESTVFVIGIEENLFQDVDLFNKWYRLGRYISEVEGVDTVLSLGSAFNIQKDAELKKFNIVPIIEGEVKNQIELDSVFAVFESLPFYKSLLYNPDSYYSLMAISMSNNRFNSTEREEFFASILDRVEEFEETNDIQIKYSGMPFIRQTLNMLVRTELKLFILLTVIVTIIILWIFFKSVKPVMISMLVVILGVIWSLGAVNLLGYEITILTSLIPPLIIVIGIPNCIYLINTFHAELNAHGNKAKALVRVVSKIGKATFMTNATTAVGFLTFIFTQSIILVEFGIVAFLSIMFLFFLSLVVITITFSYMKVGAVTKTDHLERKWIINLIKWFVRTSKRDRKWVYGCTIALVLVSIGGVFQIRTTGNIVDDLPKNHPVVADLHWFESNFGGVVPFEIEVNAGDPKQAINPRLLKKIDDTQALLVEEKSFSRSLSIVDALKFVRQAFYNGNIDRYDLIESNERAFFKDYIDNAEKSQSLLNTYLDSTQQYARISLQMADIGTIEMDSLLNRVKPKVDAIFNPKRQKEDSLIALIESEKNALVRDSIAGFVLSTNAVAKRTLISELSAEDSAAEVDLKALTFESGSQNLALLKSSLKESYTDLVFTGPSVTFLEGTNYLVRNLFISLSIAIVIVAMLMALVFSSFRMIVVSVVTNLIPLLFTAAVMGYFGIAIKPSTLLVFSIAFGISVDDTIHFLAKYRQELKNTGNDIGESVRKALADTGVSMVYTSIILFFGFSVFDSSQFGGTQALGVLVSLTLLVAMFANLILLPSFLLSFEKRMITKSFQEPFLTILDEEDDLEIDDLDFEEGIKIES